MEKKMRNVLAICLLVYGIQSQAGSISTWGDQGLRIKGAEVTKIGSYGLNDANWITISVEHKGKKIMGDISGNLQPTGGKGLCDNYDQNLVMTAKEKFQQFEKAALSGRVYINFDTSWHHKRDVNAEDFSLNSMNIDCLSRFEFTVKE
jgi:hypothetical protein